MLEQNRNPTVLCVIINFLFLINLKENLLQRADCIIKFHFLRKKLKRLI